MAPRLDFDAIRSSVPFETVLARYRIESRGKGVRRMILCPFHDDRTPSCSVDLERRRFCCFACGARGSILDFVARMESCSLTEAAEKLAADAGSSLPSAGTRKTKPNDWADGNRPLGFTLRLEAVHPYLASRGVSPSMATRFGIGYCDHSMMKGRICIPLHDAYGRLVGYAGRWAAPEPPNGVPRYRLPRGFRKSHVLFNVHRVAQASHLVVVEGIWSVLRLEGLGIAAVALMGCTLSNEQEAMLLRTAVERITLLLDGDDAGCKATAEILPRLARHRLVRSPDLPAAAEPDTMDQDRLLALVHKPVKT